MGSGEAGSFNRQRHLHHSATIHATRARSRAQLSVFSDSGVPGAGAGPDISNLRRCSASALAANQEDSVSGSRHQLGLLRALPGQA